MSDCPRCNQPEQYGCGCTTQEMYYCSVARIAELEAENKRLRLEAAHANDTADVAIERAKKLEALLVKAVGYLEKLDRLTARDAALVQAAIAELSSTMKGQDDD